MNNFIIRTEDFKDSAIESVFVETNKDREIINSLKSDQQTLLIGSRGVGKTMLLKMAEIELSKEYEHRKYLPVFLSFVKGVLINRQLNSDHFRYWMISKILNSFRKSLLEKGILTNKGNPFEMLFNSNSEQDNTLDKLISLLEETWNTEIILDAEKITEILMIERKNFKFINEIDSVKELISQFCKSYRIEKVVILFDEACHNFIPEQQREFFSMIRDLRSSYICCKAAVYPGITYYGTLQKFHDTNVMKVERDITEQRFIQNMREIVEKQSSSDIYKSFTDKGKELDALIICSTGNPRLLLKSLEHASKNFKGLKVSDVNNTIIDFYRNQIWDEHTKLSNIYKGHKELINWSRNFLENSVIPETNRKNKERKPKQTSFFAIHRDAPEIVKNAIKILEYTGIISINSESTKVRGNIYDRYQINLGVIIASENSNQSIERSSELFSGLSQKIYTDYSQSSPAFKEIQENTLIKRNFENTNLALEAILNMSIATLGFSSKQIINLNAAGFFSIHDILTKKETDLMKANQIGPSRSKSIYSTAYNAAIEFISG